MGHRFKDLVAALKDKASLSAALICSSAAGEVADPAFPTSSPKLAVLRATTHHPSTSSPIHLDALLTYGHGSRLAAAACIDALLSRLRSTRHPSVALKSLLAVHHLLTRGSFVLRDLLISASLRPASGHNPLNLSSFRDSSSAESRALSDWVRWFARLLEMLLLVAARVVSADDDRVASQSDVDILIDIEALVAVVEEVEKAPEAVEGNSLVAEAVRLAEEDRLTAEREILVRVREMGERLGLLRLGELAELVHLLKRLEQCGDRPVGGSWRVRPREWLWREVKGLMGKARDVVVREEGEREKVTRDGVSVSARVTNRVPPLTGGPVRSCSNRFEGGGPSNL